MSRLEIIVPKLYEDMESADLLQWYKKENDPVKAGEPIFSLETEKAIFDIESEQEGIIKAILVKGDTKVTALEIVGYLEIIDSK